jgi:DNA-binding transcriptional MerR regulator
MTASEEPEELSISQAAHLAGVSVHTLRYYEDQQLLDVPRTPSGRRRYGVKELAAIRFIVQLRKSGMPMSTIREHAVMVREGTSTSESNLRLLTAHRAAVEANLAEQQEYLRVISAKIDFYLNQKQLETVEPEVTDGAGTRTD